MDNLVVISPSQLGQMIREAMQDVLGPALDATRRKDQPEGGEMLSEREACAYLGGISKPTLHKLVGAGKVQKHKAGEKRNLYSRADLRAYVLNQKAD